MFWLSIVRKMVVSKILLTRWDMYLFIAVTCWACLTPLTHFFQVRLGCTCIFFRMDLVVARTTLSQYRYLNLCLKTIFLVICCSCCNKLCTWRSNPVDSVDRYMLWLRCLYHILSACKLCGQLYVTIEEILSEFFIFE